MGQELGEPANLGCCSALLPAGVVRWFSKCKFIFILHENTSIATYSGMRLDMERWFFLPLLPSTGLVGCGRLAKTRPFLRGELSFNLIDERHYQEWLRLSVPVFGCYL